MTTTSISAPRPTSSTSASLLRDQLAQFSGASKPASAATVSGRSVLGWFLTFCGLGASGWVLFAINATIFHPERVGLPVRLVKMEDLTMTLPSGQVLLPPVAVTIIAFLVTAILLAIAGKIAVALVRLGASLVLGVKPDFSGQMLRAEDQRV